jgi:endonuclease/exonuclease/phosphatase family metal-dependent hydrolase
MRIATFNVENLFDRAKALDPTDWSLGRPALEAHARINTLLEEPEYTKTIKDEIVELLGVLDLTRDDEAEFAILRQNKGRLVRRPQAGGVEVIADGRGDWIGWVELTTEPVGELATQHVAQVLKDVDADILGVVEAENRIALKRFTDAGVLDATKPRYPHVMLVDGNDDRGIDVGVLAKRRYPLQRLVSHVDDVDHDGTVFSRDCPEYVFHTASGERLVLLVNHLKSKGFGRQSDNDARRRRQATRVAELYRRLVGEGVRLVVVVGDLNDTPDSDPLTPLLQQTDLVDITEHPNFTSDGRPGTHRNGTASQKIDYVLLSPALFERVTGGLIFRKGVWGGQNGTLFPHYPTMTEAVHAASDHALVYADLDLE